MKLQKITQTLLIASILASILIIARGNILSKTSLIYLVWNLFLAWIPYFISSFVKKDIPIKKFVLLFIPWLLFFPNAPYLVTDVIHISTRTSFPLWYDSLIFFFFGLLGLLIGMISLHHIHEYIKAYKKPWMSEFIIVIICFISSFGIYLGRFKRFNSWDLFTNPTGLIRDSFDLSTNLHRDGSPLVFIIVFTLFIYCSYKIMYVLLKKE